MTGVTTQNRAAFESLTQALQDLDAYHKNPDASVLAAAKKHLDEALNKDPSYLGAVFYCGVVADLDGRPADAPPFFERVIASAPPVNVLDVARYNLGVAYYHQYSHQNLDKAKAIFDELIASGKNPSLTELVRANLAQADAMHMHPSAEQKAKHTAGRPFTDVHPELTKDYEAAKRNAQECLKRLGLAAPEQRPTIEATAQNALGMAEMYHADYAETEQAKRLKHAKEALAEFRKAEKAASTDWANTCDLASAYLRISIWDGDPTQRAEAYKKSKELLQLVLTRLRPNYGFARYELGRLYRCHGEFRDSVTSFDLALSIEARYRNVSDADVTAQKVKALAQDRSFP